MTRNTWNSITLCRLSLVCKVPGTRMNTFGGTETRQTSTYSSALCSHCTGGSRALPFANADAYVDGRYGRGMDIITECVNIKDWASSIVLHRTCEYKERKRTSMYSTGTGVHSISCGIHPTPSHATQTPQHYTHRSI